MERRFCKLSRFVLHMGFILSIAMTLYALISPLFQNDALHRELQNIMLRHYLELPIVVAAECVICAVLIESYHKKLK